MTSGRNRMVKRVNRNSTSASGVQMDEAAEAAAQTAASSEAKFKRRVFLFLRKWSAGSSAHPRQDDPYRETPDDYLVRWTYRRVWMLRKKEGDALLSLMLRNVGKRYKGPHDIDGKPFKQALLLMSWWCEENLGRQLLSPRRRMMLSDAMEYAYRHDVPPKFVNGFIQQAGIGTVRDKLTAGHVEPGFKRSQVRAASTAAS